MPSTEHEQILAEVESGFDNEYRAVSLPHPNRFLSAWYLLTVCEDCIRNSFVSTGDQRTEGELEFTIDRLKYSLKFGLGRIFGETTIIEGASLPQRVLPKLYERTGDLLRAGREYIDAHQLCSAAHARTVRFTRQANVVEAALDEAQHDKRYAALELMGHGDADAVHHAALFYAWSREAVALPPVLDHIAALVKVRNRLLRYDYQQPLALDLSKHMFDQLETVPEGWRFPWGGQHETTLILNALSVRCLYHLVAIHFGSRRLRLTGGGHDNICLVLSHEQLVLDLELMTSLSRPSIGSFVSFLTYGTNTSTPDPALQPFVPLGSKRLGIPCIHFLSSNHVRNLLALHARVQKDSFDASSKLFEQQMIRGLAARLEGRWPTRANIKPLGHRHEELDMLVCDVHSWTLLVCEMRWMLQPGEPREVQQKKVACREKVAQLERKVAWVRDNLDALLVKAFGISTPPNPPGRWQIEGAVVIETFAGTLSPNPSFPVIPSDIFELGMLKAPTLAQFAAWAKSLAWLPMENTDFEVSSYERNIGDLTLRTLGMTRLTSKRQHRERLTTRLMGTF